MNNFFHIFKTCCLNYAQAISLRRTSLHVHVRACASMKHVRRTPMFGYCTYVLSYLNSSLIFNNCLRARRTPHGRARHLQLSELGRGVLARHALHCRLRCSAQSVTSCRLHPAFANRWVQKVAHARRCSPTYSCRRQRRLPESLRTVISMPATQEQH